jgi:hypothetical protein
MSWRLSGSYFENCNCFVVCPCTVSSTAMPGHEEVCRVTLVYHLADGEIEGVRVDGLTLALVVDAPGAMSRGGWKVGVVLDAAADEAQAEQLLAVFSGQRGGPPAALAAMVGEVLGVERASMDYADEGRRHRLRAGRLIDLELEDYVPPGGSEVARLTGMTITPNPTVSIATATRARIRAFGLDLDHEGRNGHAATFAWAN